MSAGSDRIPTGGGLGPTGGFAMHHSPADAHLASVADGIRHLARQQQRLVGRISQPSPPLPAMAASTATPSIGPFADVIDTVARPSVALIEGFTPSDAGVDDPFESVIAAVSGSSSSASEVPAHLPDSSRFMVRVAQVEEPHRKTKRNYDYFQDLNEALAAKAAERRLTGETGTL